MWKLNWRITLEEEKENIISVEKAAFYAVKWNHNETELFAVNDKVGESGSYWSSKLFVYKLRM